MVTIFAIVAQLSGIMFVRIWGRYSDKYSNKNVILICAPLYIAGMLIWAFTAVSSSIHFTITLLTVINILTGVATSGINLSLNNLGIKLAPSGHAMVYLSAKNMLIAVCSAAAPLLGGLIADSLSWNFFFVVSAVLAMLSVRLLKSVAETGEEKKGIVLGEMFLSFKTRLISVPAVLSKRIKK
jgi:MFS family permease